MKRKVKLDGGMELPLESSLGHLIRTIHRMQAQLLQARLAEDGISLGCWYFLRVLWHGDMITQRELSLRTGVNEATTRTAVDRMEAEDLVARKLDATDRRKRFIGLTTRAQDLKPVLIEFADDLNKRILDVLPAGDRRDFLLDLVQIHDHIRSMTAGLKAENGLDNLP